MADASYISKAPRSETIHYCCDYITDIEVVHEADSVLS